MDTKTDALKRLGLNDGDFFAEYRYKNLHWDLNGQRIGFGDLREDDILRIMGELEPGEEFVGWNEHHGSDWQQTNTPMIRITHTDIMFREDVVEVEGR